MPQNDAYVEAVDNEAPNMDSGTSGFASDGTMSFSVRGSRSSMASFMQAALSLLQEQASNKGLTVTSFSSYTNEYYDGPNSFSGSTPTPSRAR